MTVTPLLVALVVLLLLQTATIGALVVPRSRRRDTEAGQAAMLEELREAQERYQRAIVAGGVAAWERNMETNAVRVDRLFKELVGIDPDDVGADVGGWWSLVHPDDLPNLAARVEEHLRDR